MRFSAPMLLKEGTSAYAKITYGKNRWGDYSATLVDPEKPHAFWTLQQVATGPQAWTVWITEILVDPYLEPGPEPGLPAPPFQELGEREGGDALNAAGPSDSLGDPPERAGPVRDGKAGDGG